MTRKQKRLLHFLKEQAEKMKPAEAIDWLKKNDYVDPEKVYWYWRHVFVSIGYNDRTLRGIVEEFVDNGDEPLKYTTERGDELE